MSDIEKPDVESPVTGNQNPAKKSIAGITMPEPKVMALVAALFLLVVLVFWESLQNLWSRWGSSEELSHSYFIPVISGGLLWMRRDALIAAIGIPWIPGLVVSGLGLVFAITGAVIDVPLVSQIGLVVFLVGIPGAVWGRKVFFLCLIPMLYLFLMVPPPHMLITIMSAKFQAMSTELGVGMIRLMGIPVHNSGNVIDLGEHQLEVVDACSGLRYLFPFMSLGAIAAYIYKGKWWERLIVFGATIPITIVMNSLRIALTAALVRSFGESHAEGTVHMFEGWMVFLLCLAILYAIIWLLSKFVQKRPVAEVFGVPEINAEPSLTGAQAYNFKRSATIAVVVIGGLLVALAATKLVGNRVIYEPNRLEFATLPLEFVEYESREKTVSNAIENVIGADDFTIIDFIRPEMRAPVNVYIAYVNQQKEGKSWHSPQQCLPGGGWEFVEHTVEKVTMPDGRIMAYNRIIIKFGDVRQLVYYWYDQRGRMVANEFMVRLYVMIDALVKGRKDGAMIRLMTVVAEDEKIEDAEARLDKFRLELYPILPKYIPGDIVSKG